MKFGINICAEITKLEKEVAELERGLDALGDEVGQQSPAYKVVDEMRKKKAEQLREKLYTEYEVKDDEK